MLCDKSRARDLMIQAKVALAANPPNTTHAEKCIALLQKEFSPSYAKKFVDSVEKYRIEKGIRTHKGVFVGTAGTGKTNYEVILEGLLKSAAPYLAKAIDAGDEDGADEILEMMNHLGITY